MSAELMAKKHMRIFLERYCVVCVFAKFVFKVNTGGPAEVQGHRMRETTLLRFIYLFKLNFLKLKMSPQRLNCPFSMTHNRPILRQQT